MPWCPKCKLEYKEGVTSCSDCNSDLVEELIEEETFLPVAGLDEAEAAERLVKFLASEGFDGTIERSEENQLYLVLVPQSQIITAKKCVEAFFQVESEFTSKNEPFTELEEPEEVQNSETLEASKPSSPYVKKREKSKDLKSTAITFVSFSILGFLFLGLNIAGVIQYFNNTFSYVVVGGMLLAFLWIGFSSFRMSKKAAAEAVEEEALTEKLNAWLAMHMTEQTLNSFDDPSQPEELNFLRKMEGIKKMILQEFGSIDDSYLDSIVEDFYNKTF